MKNIIFFRLVFKKYYFWSRIKFFTKDSNVILLLFNWISSTDGDDHYLRTIFALNRTRRVVDTYIFLYHTRVAHIDNNFIRKQICFRDRHCRTNKYNIYLKYTVNNCCLIFVALFHNVLAEKQERTLREDSDVELYKCHFVRQILWFLQFCIFTKKLN